MKRIEVDKTAKHMLLGIVCSNCSNYTVNNPWYKNQWCVYHKKEHIPPTCPWFKRQKIYASTIKTLNKLRKIKSKDIEFLDD